MNKQPEISVGIFSKSTIRFKFNGVYKLQETGKFYEGEFVAGFWDGKIIFEEKLYSELSFVPLYYETASFDLFEVSIGIQFHWERKETQSFKGNLCFMVAENEITAVNILLLEDYLLSVISSEMRATSSLELLKAHAVISRSWLLAQLNKQREIEMQEEIYQSSNVTESEIVRWYDREEHKMFDVCADDHCQRYQGLSKISTPMVKDALMQTSGEVLMTSEGVCDARFSKCCGGITEEFENCWEPVPHSYLKSVYCAENQIEFKSWEDWIMTSPPAFCNTNDKTTLSQVLNDYDQETNDFYRWKVIYTQDEIRELIEKKTGLRLGKIIDIVPDRRGASGRIVRLLISGTERNLYIGKELEIRKTLSESHLYSSAFVVEKRDIIEGIPQEFILHGAGWGHGVGLCQIGAAIMAEKGFHYHDILKHYFQGVYLEKLYSN